MLNSRTARYITVLLCLLSAWGVGNAAQADVSIPVIGQWGGVCKTADVSGNYAYAGMGDRLAVLDVSVSATPTMIWKSQPLGSVIRGVVVSDGFAYVSTAYNLTIFDLSNPAIPVQRGTYAGSSEDGSVGMRGEGCICITDTRIGLFVLDVSNPDSPTLAAICDLSEEGDAHKVVVNYNRAYVQLDTDVCIVDLSNPLSPRQIGKISGLEAYENAMVNNYMYFLRKQYGAPTKLIIMDVSVLPYGNVVGSCDVPNACGITVYGNYAYVSAGEDGLHIVNIMNPKTPWLSQTCNTAGIARQAKIVGTKAYVASDYGGLQIVNIATPGAASVIGGYFSNTDARDIVVANNRAYVADGVGGLQILDISDIAKPVRIGGYDTPVYASSVTLAGNYIYVADGTAGLQIFDGTDLSNPVRVGGYDTAGTAQSVAVSGNYAYVADQAAGLQVIDISNPAAPVKVGGYVFEGPLTPHYVPNSLAYDVEVYDNRAYVSADELYVLDISNSSNPVVLGRNSGYSGRYGVALSGNYAYTIDAGWMRVIDVTTNPAVPTSVGSYYSSSWFMDVVIQNNYAYLADLYRGLQVVDVSFPSAPVLVGGDGYGKACYGVAASGSYAFKANGELGVEICRVGMHDAAMVSAVSPNEAPESGSVSIMITGTGFQSGAAVRLRKAGQNDIVATNVNVRSATKITCSMDIRGRMGGAWNVIVTNPQSLQGSLVNGFTVIDTTPPTITSTTVPIKLVPTGSWMWLGVSVTDNTGCVGVSVDGVALSLAGGAWVGSVPASTTPGIHYVTIVARDAAGNTRTDSSKSYKAAQVVGASNRSLSKPIMTTASANFIYRIWGKVTKVDANNFKVDDGSGTPVLVNYYNHGLVTGNYAQATGMWQTTGTTPLLAAASYSIKKLK